MNLYHAWLKNTSHSLAKNLLNFLRKKSEPYSGWGTKFSTILIFPNKTKSVKAMSLKLEYSRDDIKDFSKIFLVKYSIYICIDINLLKGVAYDLLQSRKIEKWYLLRLTGRKAFVNNSHCSKLQSVKHESQWNNYLQIIWDYVLFHSQISKYGRNSAKKELALFKRCHQALPNFIGNELFDTQIEDSSLPDHSTLYLEHKYLE